ncbi:hypothetical protein C7M84_005815 [Penaeus vannamei]|uniref:Uncharacterized protein n=1 Tax=Penaeus vannamei TaxID=6689 RepID=A0A3R7MG89_PENVA|nr:hypothetical protein C7M84_005815 [Penaeus vannamei]
MVIKKEDAVPSPSKVDVQPLVVCVPPGGNSLAPNMRLVQTADGKKLLLTNVVKTSKPSPTSSNQAVMKVLSSKPPAYLNIRIKEEPNDEPIGELVYVDGGVKIKDEPIDPQTELEEALEMASQKPFVDVRIKEEPSEENELLEKDEQLRKVLEATSPTSTNDASNKPRRFYIRTSEGKLISISPEEAEALGLNHEDKAEENQKKLVKALAGVGDFPLKKVLVDQKRLEKTQCTVLIPDNVDVKDFVSRNVPPAAEKEATLMKTLKCSSEALEAQFSTSKIFVPTKTNTTIIENICVPMREKTGKKMKVEILYLVFKKDLHLL